MKSQPVREQLLDHTFTLIRRRGFNGFSYRDLAELVGVKTSSIHYYFPCKEDLALEATRQYSARIAEQLRLIDDKLSAAERAERYLSGWSFDSDQICMCGMLATEAESLPESVHAALKDFFALNERWIAQVLEQAKAEGASAQSIDSDRLAMVIFGALQNGLVSARLFKSPQRWQAAAELLRAAVAPRPN
ncbi:TetR/AcrR family transcriptional regulator [Cupriavidus sp. AU9028]|uniref:TetR/AcrR family transcriptional regulator n=1 Tax=Cupriavidus sp. AU9028 TaxID=2871157 RepID=UPI001C977F54|nr:TetR/AcrR family transcriptional regulator [Cupriavidus sp. AU9028]MBY4896039.1 TetR/AcrR family transcriptional regulator [Cupriavidus sp. AU9028]